MTQSISQSVLALSPSGSHGQILAAVKTAAVLLPWGVFTDGRTGLSCNRSQSLSVLVIYICTFIFYKVSSWYVFSVTVFFF
jgi:hypothetical protein